MPNGRKAVPTLAEPGKKVSSHRGVRPKDQELVPLLTVGDLRSELSRWSDQTPVIFCSPLRKQEFRFYRYRAGEGVLVLEINEFPETPGVVLPAP
jgi:hypothetical protein